MKKLKRYYELAELLRVEANLNDPKDSANQLVQQIEQYSPGFQALVFYKRSDPAKPWILVPVPSDALPNIQSATYSKLGDGGTPTAYWKRRK